jgi:hypothetical protein
VGTLDIQVHCINLEDTVGFAAPRCRSPTWRITDPIAFQLCGATSLMNVPRLHVVVAIAAAKLAGSSTAATAATLTRILGDGDVGNK